jgi:hypothetical protein
MRSKNGGSADQEKEITIENINAKQDHFGLDKFILVRL